MDYVYVLIFNCPCTLIGSTRVYEPIHSIQHIYIHYSILNDTRLKADNNTIIFDKLLGRNTRESSIVLTMASIASHMASYLQ